MRYLSLFSGIEAASVAWSPLGWEPVAFAERDPFPSAVLAHHYPSVPNWGDVTRFREWPDAAPDVLVGGSPCQSFSVAGLRKGLDDPRGNLALVYLAILDRYRPRWCVWENVPGVLSSGGGRDFGAFVGGLGQLGYGWAYRVLDAQYFGLAQRRKRVFVVGHLGDWRRAAAVLFERESLSGHPAPRREAWQNIAPTVSSGSPFSGTGNERVEAEAMIVADIAGCLAPGAHPGGFNGQDAYSGQLVAGTLRSTDGGLDCDHAAAGHLIAHSLRAVGFDASEDGPGRGTPLVPVAFNWQNGGGYGNAHEGLGTTIDGTGPLSRSQVQAVAYGIRADAARDGIAKTPSPDAEGRIRLRDPGLGIYQELAPTVDASQAHSVAHGTGVRRLTPRECERLQGFRDDYTLVPYRGKPAADGPRYKALGNSMAVPCMHWIGSRIAQVDTITYSPASQADRDAG